MILRVGFTAAWANRYSLLTLARASKRGLMGRWLQVSVLSASAAAALLFFLWPSDALAWGPLAHLNFSSGALRYSQPLLGGVPVRLTGRRHHRRQEPVALRRPLPQLERGVSSAGSCQG